MKSVAYIRVSTTDQHLENQKISIEREATRNTDSIGHFYQDHAVSGVQTKRDGLQQLICDARKNKFQRLYVYDLSRLSRSVKHRIAELIVLSYSEIPDDQAVKVIKTIELNLKDKN